MPTSKHAPIQPHLLVALRCPVCQDSFEQTSTGLRCIKAHGFDRARQGHITLGTGAPVSRNADTPAMVSARDALLATGVYGPIRTRAAEAIASSDAAQGPHPLIADLAGGTGYYLAGLLHSLPDALGVCIDLSPAAVKRAARSHPSALAVGADLSRTFPLADRSISVVTSFFGPRNVPEIGRVLGEGGILAVVAPTSEHLRELIDPLGMIRVHPEKERHLAETLLEFVCLTSERVEYDAFISRGEARLLVEMGPSAHHVSAAQLSARLATLPELLCVRVSVTLGIYKKR